MIHLSQNNKPKKDQHSIRKQGPKPRLFIFLVINYFLIED